MKPINCKTNRKGCCERVIEVGESDFADVDGPHIHLFWVEQSRRGNRKPMSLDMHDDQAERVAKAILRMVASHRTKTHRETNRRIKAEQRKVNNRNG